MTGMAAVLFCGAFTSCSHDDITSAEDISKAQAEQITKTYETAFLKYVGGEIGKNQTWGFGTAASARTRTESADANLWGDPTADGGKWNYKVPPALSDDQKNVVRKYFQTVKKPEYQDPEWDSYFMQQVYKGHTAGKIGENSPEAYKSADENDIIGSDKMNHLVAVFPNGNLDHINNFNHGTCSQNSDVLNTGASTNSHDPNDWHTDEIMLMENSTTNAFGYYNSDGSLYHDQYTGLVSYKTIMQVMGAEANCLDDGWNRSFMGFDFEQMVGDDILTDDKLTWGNVTNFNNYTYAYYSATDIRRIKTTPSESNGWQASPLEGWDYTDLVNAPNGIYFLDSDMNMYCGDVRTLKEQGTEGDNDCIYFYKDIDENNKNQMCLNMVAINKMIDDGYLPKSGDFKTWVKVGGCADEYYSDWIVCLTKAEKQGTTPPPTPSGADLRIMAEDLSAEDDTDFDFNDIVFDVYFSTSGTTKIVVQAAGGTLPLRIWTNKEGDPYQEVHALWSDIDGISTGTMINTGAEARYGFPRGADNRGTREVTLYYSVPDAAAAKNIKIEVQKTTSTGTEWIEMRAEQAEPAAKFATDPDNQWLSERTSIKSAIPSFVQWVQGNIPALNWK